MSAAENWRRRTEMITYCVEVADQSMSEKQKLLESQTADKAEQRRIQGAIYAEGVKVSRARFQTC